MMIKEGKKKQKNKLHFLFPVRYLFADLLPKTTAEDLFFIHKDTAHDCVFIYGVHNGQQVSAVFLSD